MTFAVDQTDTYCIPQSTHPYEKINISNEKDHTVHVQTTDDFITDVPAHSTVQYQVPANGQTITVAFYEPRVSKAEAEISITTHSADGKVCEGPPPSSTKPSTPSSTQLPPPVPSTFTTPTVKDTVPAVPTTVCEVKLEDGSCVSVSYGAPKATTTTTHVATSIAKTGTPSLPETGFPTGQATGLGGILVAAGIVAVFFGRRSRESTT